MTDDTRHRAGGKIMDDLTQRLRVRGMQDNEMPNHYVRRMEIDRMEAAEARVAELTRERDTLAAHVNQARGLWSGLYKDANDLLARTAAAEARVAELEEAKTTPVAYAMPFPPPDAYYALSADVLHDVASFPNVISAHDIARAVLDEQIDRQQGFVTKEDCCLYVDATLRNLGTDNG